MAPVRVSALLFAVFFLLGAAGAASVYDGNFSVEDFESEGEPEPESHPVVYLLFYVVGQFALVHVLGGFFFGESDVTKSISVVGIMIPWLFFANLAPFGFFLGLWGYFALVKFRFDTRYRMAALIVVPVYLYIFLIQLMFL